MSLPEEDRPGLHLSRRAADVYALIVAKAPNPTFPTFRRVLANMQPFYGIDRRQLLRIGGAGVVGATVPFLNPSAHATNGALSDQPGFGRAKSVLIVLLSGGPSQLDMWDPKPDSPSEVRGEFSTIPTTIPGIEVCEHLPILAKQTSRWSIT